MTYIEREKTSELDYDIFISDRVKNYNQKEVEEIINKALTEYDVIFCSPRKDTASFDNYFLLPRLKDKYSTGYDVGIRGTTILNSVKRVELGVKTVLPEYFSIEMKLRSGTFKKHEVMLTNAVGEIDSSYTGQYLAELIPIMYFSSRGKDNNAIPVLNQFDYTDPNTRIDYLQLKLIPVNTHLVSPTMNKPLKIIGIVCEEIWNNFAKYFPSDRGEGGFHSTDKKLEPASTLNYVTGELKIVYDVNGKPLEPFERTFLDGSVIVPSDTLEGVHKTFKEEIFDEQEYDRFEPDHSDYGWNDEYTTAPEIDETKSVPVKYEEGQGLVVDDERLNLSININDFKLTSDFNDRQRLEVGERLVEYKLHDFNSTKKYCIWFYKTEDREKIELLNYFDILEKDYHKLKFVLDIVNQWLNHKVVLPSLERFLESFRLLDELLVKHIDKLNVYPIETKKVGIPECNHFFVNKPSFELITENNHSYKIYQRICSECGRIETVKEPVFVDELLDELKHN